MNNPLNGRVTLQNAKSTQSTTHNLGAIAEKAQFSASKADSNFKNSISSTSNQTSGLLPSST